ANLGLGTCTNSLRRNKELPGFREVRKSLHDVSELERQVSFLKPVHNRIAVCFTGHELRISGTKELRLFPSGCLLFSRQIVAETSFVKPLCVPSPCFDFVLSGLLFGGRF